MFDKKEVYERDILPLAQQLLEACKAADLTFIFHAHVMDNGEAHGIAGVACMSQEHEPPEAMSIAEVLITVPSACFPAGSLTMIDMAAKVAYSNHMGQQVNEAANH